MSKFFNCMISANSFNMITYKSVVKCKVIHKKDIYKNSITEICQRHYIVFKQKDLFY